MESRIQALLTETEIQYLESQIQNPKLFWIPSHVAATVFFDKAKASGSELSRGALTSIHNYDKQLSSLSSEHTTTISLPIISLPSLHPELSIDLHTSAEERKIAA